MSESTDDFSVTDFLGGNREEMAMNFLQQMDEQQIEQAITAAVERFLVPQLEEIRRSAQEVEDKEEVREVFEELSEGDQEDVFNETMSKVQMAAVEIREEPVEGAKTLKDLLRDPWTVEALLLVFDEPDKIDPEYADHLKDFVSTQIRWMGVHVAPEMYSEEEIREVVDTVYPDLTDEEARQKLRERGIDVE